MISVEPFAGCGGMTLGLHAAGFECVRATDAAADAVETLRQVIPSATVSRLDVVSAGALGHWLREEHGVVDLLAAGPPCQPWSAAGGRRGADDPRDGFPALLALADTLCPRTILLENVPGLLFPRHEAYFDAVVGSIFTLGYAVQARVLCAADYGVPQRRRRLFVIAVPHRAPFEWPAPTHSEAALVYAKYVAGSYCEEHDLDPDDLAPPTRREAQLLRCGAAHEARDLLRWRTVRDALGDACVIGGGGNPHGQDRSGERNFRDMTDDVAPVVSAAQVGNRGPWIAAPPGDVLRWKRQRARPHQADEAAMTVRAMGGKGPEFMQAAAGVAYRRLSVRECACLQALPDWLKFAGSTTSQYRQVGNAVPPPMAEAVGAAVRGALS